jgi:hypothetical protein
MDQSEEDHYSQSGMPSDLPHCPHAINDQTQNGYEARDREDICG